MIWKSKVIACGLALAVFCGCSTTVGIGDPYFMQTESAANVYASQGVTKVLKIAVMPFKASAELIGSSVSDMVVTELLKTRKYSLVERGQMARVLSETELAMAGLSEAKAVEAAKLMGAEAVVIGTVDEYGTQAKSGDTYAVVGLSIRLIDCANGKIVWSADLAKIADDEDTPLAKHAREVVHELVAGLYQNLVGQSGSQQPSPPTGLAVSEMGLREAVLQWNRPACPAKCQIERSVSDAGPFSLIGEVAAENGTYVDKSGLKDGATYYYRLRLVGKAGATSEPSEVVETMTAPPPDAPTGVNAAAPSSRCVQLSWSPPRSDGVTEYRVERAVAGTKDWQQVGTTATAAFKDGGFKGCSVADSTTYGYRVLAVNRVGAVGAPSKPVSVTTLPPPAAVADFAAPSREIRCVPLSWKASPEGDVVGYELEMADGDGDFKSLEEIDERGTTSFLHGDKDPGNLLDEHTYRYRIRAVNDVGSMSAWSEATATTKPAPKVPAGVTTTKDLAGKVKISWTKNPEPDIVEYRVEVRGLGGMFWSKVGNTAGCSVEECGLKPGEDRTYRVMAVGPKDHQSFWSPEVSGTARQLPPPPTGLQARKTDSGYRITFKPPREGMTQFRVYRKKFFGSDLLVEDKVPSVELPAAAVGEGIDIVATAVDECGLESEQSEKLAIK